MAAVVMLSLAGCGGESGAQRTGGLQPALDAYAAGQFSRAVEHAQAAASQETGVERDRANYVAGLAAYRSHQLNQAAGYFQLAEHSTDSATAANSQAMLGVIRLREDRPMEAANYLERSADHLEPTDARQAARWTAFAYEQTGDLASAARARRSGTAHEPTRVSPAAISSPSPSGRFALQVGAFEKRSGADKAAEIAAAATSGTDLGPVRVFERDSGENKPRFLVQVGAFNSRSAAASARKRVGQLAYIVAPAADGRILETVWPRRRIAEAQRLN